MKQILKKIFLYIFFLAFILAIAIFLINCYVLSFEKNNRFHSVEELGKKYIWIVFWASVKEGKPSLILKDRLDVAFEAYKRWKIEKIIVSWDNWKANYNEPTIMKKYLLSLWVKQEDIYEDFAGFDTYDSLYRAKEIFKVEELVLFTQDFHLKRAIYIAERLWIKAYWVETNLRKYSRPYYNQFREVFARVKAFIEIELTKPKPKYLWNSIKVVSNDDLESIKETLKQDIFWENNTWIFEQSTGKLEKDF